METVVLKTNGIIKSYKGKYVLRNVNMTINKGDIYGFVGENGAGKTTVIRAITGLIHLDQGDFDLFGVNSKSPDFQNAMKKTAGIVEKPSFFGSLSAVENVMYQQLLVGLEANKEEAIKILNDVDLGEAIEGKKVKDFSLGMKQRLAIAMSMVNNPEFMILDEPMNGLDPKGISDLRTLILKLNKERQVTFLISSHILSELDLIATKYGIISKGQIIREIEKSRINELEQKYVSISTDNNSKAVELLKKCNDNLKIQFNNEEIKIFDCEDYNEILKTLLENSITINGISSKQTSFEQYYLDVMKEAK